MQVLDPQLHNPRQQQGAQLRQERQGLGVVHPHPGPFLPHTVLLQ